MFKTKEGVKLLSFILACIFTAEAMLTNIYAETLFETVIEETNDTILDDEHSEESIETTTEEVCVSDETISSSGIFDNILELFSDDGDDILSGAAQEQ